MHALQDKMLLTVDTLHATLRRLSPGQEHHALAPHFCHGVNDFLGQLLPALATVRIGFTSTDRQASVQHKHAIVSPGREETAILGWGFEIGIVFLERDVHVLQGWRSGCWWPDREAETVGLVRTVVRILAEDDCFHGGEWCVPRPIIPAYQQLIHVELIYEVL